MKHAIAMIFSLTILAAGPAVAQKRASSDDIDFATVSCGQFLRDVDSGTEEDLTAVLLWLDGYLSGVTGDTLLSFGGLEAFAEDLITLCRQYPRGALIEAARRVGIE